MAHVSLSPEINKKIIEVCNSASLNDFDKVREIHNLLTKEKYDYNCNINTRLFINKLSEESARTYINYYKFLADGSFIFKTFIGN